MIFRARLAVSCCFALLFYGLLGSAAAQGIYTCVDETGRKLTSDRPIAECMDRAQRELNPSGTLRRVLTPPPPPKDRATLDAEEKAETEARMQAADEKRRDRALRIRYPDRASHDKARASALDMADGAIKTATKRTQELADQRKAIDIELDFYKNSPAKVPAAIKRRIDETDANIAAQKRLATSTEAEKKRTSERFDAETVKLQPRWGLTDMSAAARPASAARKP